MTEKMEFWQKQNIQDALALKEYPSIPLNGIHDIGVGDHDVWEAVKGTYEISGAEPIWMDDRGNGLTLRRYKTQFSDTYLDITSDKRDRVTARSLIRFGEKANQEYIKELAQRNQERTTG